MFFLVNKKPKKITKIVATMALQNPQFFKVSNTASLIDFVKIINFILSD